MKATLLKVLPWALVVVLCGSLYAEWAAHERDLGALRVQLHSADSLAKVAQAELADAKRKSTQDSSRAAALEADTAKANQQARLAKASYVALLAPLAASKHALDSLLALPHDSASTGLIGSFRDYERVADSTIKACGATVKADSVALAACQAHGEALQATLTDTRAMVQALAKDTTAKALTIRGLKAEQPSGLSIWGWRIVSAGLGYLIGRAK